MIMADGNRFSRRATAYMDFIFERVRTRDPDGSLKIMYVYASCLEGSCSRAPDVSMASQVYHPWCVRSLPRIKPERILPPGSRAAGADLKRHTGDKDFPEEELWHLEGHKGSKPVRCAAFNFWDHAAQRLNSVVELGTGR